MGQRSDTNKFSADTKATDLQTYCSLKWKKAQDIHECFPDGEWWLRNYLKKTYIICVPVFLKVLVIAVACFLISFDQPWHYIRCFSEVMV